MAFRMGWDYLNENRTYLYREGQDFLRLLPKTGLYAEQVGDPRPHVTVENQGNQGSCTGHATSTIQEWLLYVETKGRVKIQLSRKFSYIRGQFHDGIRGDNGATISGSIKAAKEDGNCVENLCPYTSSYTTDISQQALEDAQKRKIFQHQKCNGYDDVRRVVGTLFGGVNIGVLITDTFMNDKTGIITPDHFRRGRVVGGHSMAILLPSERKTDDGRPYLWGPNSWGTQIHNQGWIEWHPDCFDLFANKADNELIAVTDIDEKHDDPGGDTPIPSDEEFTGRSIDFIKNNYHV